MSLLITILKFTYEDPEYRRLLFAIIIIMYIFYPDMGQENVHFPIYQKNPEPFSGPGKYLYFL
ncbi:hypothetical protein CUU66_20715 [Peribacillus deserti]|uniref:Uncharacterized protein n=1 Tax=Peribacillus deserti TaxID=673318 RepID=A0A2N5M146_9BACI|nr:hypothetical protein CUU66_20715 [Peribacillus deserti]